MAAELVDVVNPETGRIATVSATSDAAKHWKTPPSQRDAQPTTFDNPPEPLPETVVPAGNASAEEWATYARAQGATDADLADEDGKPLGRDALREKYTPTTKTQEV